MVVRKDDLYNPIELLPEPDHKTTFDFLQYLVERSNENQRNLQVEVVQKGARTLRRRASACAGHACSCTTYRTLRAHVQTSPNPCLHLTSTLFEQAQVGF